MTGGPEVPRQGEIRDALAARGHRPTKRFSQNFLTDRALLDSIVDAAGVTEGDVVLEVGPGAGTLTAALLARGAWVVAVEIDRVMVQVLRELLGSPDRLVLVEGDALAGGRAPSPPVEEALAATEARAGRSEYLFVANLPYQVASPLLIDLLWNRPPRRGAVTVQLEVADRLVAGPGSKAYGALGVLVALRAEVRKVRRLSAGSFWPAPKVDSACVRFELRSDLTTDVPSDALRRTADAVFHSRRKRLGNSIALARPDLEKAWVEERLREAGIDPDRRGETLSLDEVVRVARALTAPA